ITFNAANWNQTQTVTLFGVDDLIDDGDIAYNITSSTVSGTDTTGYVGLTPSTIGATNVDDDTACITVTPTSGLVTTEAGGAATGTDPVYTASGGMNASDVSVINIDNDNSCFTITAPASITTTEAGGVATFTVVLCSQPTANVTLSIISDDGTEGSVGSITFT